MPQNLQNILLGLAIASILCTASVSKASVTTYSSAAAFDAAMNGDMAVLSSTSYSGLTTGANGFPFVGGISGSTGNAVGTYPTYQYSTDVPFTGGTLAGLQNVNVYGYGFNNTSFPGSFLGNEGNGSSFSLNFANPVYGFAIDFGLFHNFYGIPSPILSFSFAGGSVTATLPGYMSNNPSIPVTYEGFGSDTPFTSVAIVDSSQSFSMSDITVATASQQTSSTTTSVPSPASILLLAAGSLWLKRAGAFKNVRKRATDMISLSLRPLGF